ncbi:transposase [Clostridium sp. YIM B02551]|uniref:transposase n=1 Tax=Clostridium sp. YIM B02551 TaxID=2910679 RepID=UPI001EEC5517|nr:transposase [Clostridium sp. YIM B02551]
MPRSARIKLPNGLYHVMIRSISEVKLFRKDEDKVVYLKIVKELQNTFKFKIYSYCLMNTHGHFILDSYGADISKIMHSINSKYARYYNKKYKRHGHLFQDRFKSKLITNDRYILNLSLYIHKNPLDMKKYMHSPEKYRFSSLSVFLGIKNDEFNILDEAYLLSMLTNNLVDAKNRYRRMLFSNNDTLGEIMDLNKDVNLYVSGRNPIVRKYDFSTILNFIESKYKISKKLIIAKFIREYKHFKAILVAMVRCLCNLQINQISKLIGDITDSRTSSLGMLGIELLTNNKVYEGLIEEFIKINEPVIA